MKAFLKRYHATIISFLALTLPLFLIYIHGRVRTEHTVIESVMMRITAPVQQGMGKVFAAVGGVWTDYLALVHVKARNAELEQRIAELEGQALENRRLREENQRLLGLCEFRQLKEQLDTVAARVVSKDISPYYRILRVVVQAPNDVELRPGMPVITHRGVVGRVARVAGAYADVMLTVDTRSRLDVLILGRGVSGTIEGRGDRNIYGSRFFYLHRGEPIEAGDIVVTSGHDRVFPAGLAVGYVAETAERQTGVYYEHDIIPAVNFATLEEVLIVLNERPEIPDFKKLKRGGR